jgi:hypothetical protein
LKVFNESIQNFIASQSGDVEILKVTDIDERVQREKNLINLWT